MFRSRRNLKKEDTKEAPPAPPQPETTKTPEKPRLSFLQKGPNVPDVLKTNITKRLEADVKARKPINRSPDVVPLMHEYATMRKQLRKSLAATKAYLVTVNKMNKAKNEAVDRIKALAADSPLDSVTKTMVKVSNDATKKSQQYIDLFQDKVVDYIEEWELVASARIDTEQRAVRKLHSSLEHYQSKVDKLRNTVNTQENNPKKKEVNPKTIEKLERNEEKLEQSWKEHEEAASKLCDLLEEAVKFGWKDLYPLLRSFMSIENNHASDTNDIIAQYRPLLMKLDDAHKEGNRSFKPPAMPTSSPRLPPTKQKSASLTSSTPTSSTPKAPSVPSSTKSSPSLPPPVNPNAVIEDKTNLVECSDSDDNVSETSSGFSDEPGIDAMSDSSNEGDVAIEESFHSSKNSIGSSVKSSPSRVADV